MHYRLMHVWDATVSRLEAVAYADKKLPINGGLADLEAQFDKLVSNGDTFETILFSSHGKSGQVDFDDDKWVHTETNADSLFNPKYSALFPRAGYIIFDGCNVAEGENGATFLKRMGSSFFRYSGGFVTGPIVDQLDISGALYWLAKIGTGINGGIVPSMSLDLVRGRSVPLTFESTVRRMAVVAPGGNTLQIWGLGRGN